MNGEFLSDEQIGKIQRGLRDKIALYRLDKIVPGRGKLDDVGAMACLLRNAALLAKVSLQSHLQQEPTPDVVEDLLGMKN